MNLFSKSSKRKRLESKILPKKERELKKPNFIPIKKKKFKQKKDK